MPLMSLHQRCAYGPQSFLITCAKRLLQQYLPIVEVNLPKGRCTRDIVMRALYGKVRIDLEFLRW